MILIAPPTGSLVLGIGKSGQYRVHDDSGSEDEPDGSITVLKLDIEQVETNICWKERSCALKLTDDSYPGGDVIWSSSPSGISGRGRSIRFNPSSLSPGEYEVRAHSEKVDSLDDVCLVRIVLSGFIIFVDQPGAGGDRDTYEWVNGDIDVGHVFWLYTNSYPVVVKDTQLRLFVNQYTGYYPREAVKIGTSVAGRFVMPDVGHLGTYEVSHFWGISLAQLMRGLQYSLNLQNNPGTYDLEDNNCTNATIAAGAAVGVQVPDTQGSWPTGRGSNPGDLGEDLRLLNGSGN